MIKTMHFLVRKPGMSHQECIKYHRYVYAPLAARILVTEQKLLNKCVAHYFEESPDMNYDLAIEQWYENKDWERMKKFCETFEYDELRRATDEMSDPQKSLTLSFENNVIL